jgi:hypothetical protein
VTTTFNLAFAQLLSRHIASTAIAVVRKRHQTKVTITQLPRKHNAMSQNATYKYWDNMDGDAMVCSPLGPPEYRTMCIFNQYVLGVGFFLEGLSLLYNARRLGQLASGISSSRLPKHSRSEQALRKKSHMLYFNRLTYTFALDFLCLGVMHGVGGGGTIHSSATVDGLLGDLFYAIGLVSVMHHSLVQMRGAEAFRNLVQLPTAAINSKGTMITLRKLLDFVQGVGALPIAIGLWGLLVGGILTRSEFTSGLLTGWCGSGLRHMFENILSRARTLVQVDTLQQKAGGDVNAKRRRRGILLKKARALAVDSMTIFMCLFFLPFSLLVGGSVSSSTQWLIQNGASMTIMVVMIIPVCLNTHKHVSKNITQSRRRSIATTQPWSNQVHTVADESGMSVVGESEVGTNSRQSSLQSRDALFSVVESHK